MSPTDFDSDSESDSIEQYLREAFGWRVRDVSVRSLGELGPGDTKRYGYGKPLFVSFEQDGVARKVVIETVKPGPYGHEHRSDRAAQSIWAFDTYNELPGHVRALDFGAFRKGGLSPVSLGKTTEFFYVCEFVAGSEYAEDLAALRSGAPVRALDRDRADCLADYLASVHERRPEAPPDITRAMYRRRIRELIGHGELVMGTVDRYPSTHPIITPDRLARLETQLVSWRWRLRQHEHRTRQVHGDFHPWNILFRDGVDFTALDRARGQWGEPADDVTCLALNYVFFAHQADGGPSEGLLHLHERFWERYLGRCADAEILDVAAPFVAFRCLVMAHPEWYPDLSDALRESLILLAERALDAPRFDPGRVAEWMRP